MKRGLFVSGTLLTAVAVAVLTHLDQTRAVRLTLMSAPRAALGGALALVLCQVGLQAARLWAIVPRDVASRPGRVAHAFTLGEWTNIFTPACAGDALKVVLLSRTSNVNLATATGAVLADKIVDAGSLMVLCLASGITGLIGAETRLRAPAAAIVCAAAVGLTLVYLGVRWARPTWLEQLARGLSALKDPVRLVDSTAFSVGAWSAEVLALHVLSHGLGFSVPYPMLILALGVLNVGISVPVGAANMGVYEAALAFGLRHAGAPLPSAVAIAALHHVLELVGINIAAAALTLTVASRSGRPIWSWARHTLS